MKKVDLAYAAGIIDGEGCITIQKKKNKTDIRPHASLLVAVASTDEWLCNWLKFAFGGSACQGNTKTKAGNTVWYWQITTRQAGEFLQLILPYLKMKRPQAELALQFQSNKRCGASLGSFPNKPKSEKERAVEEAQIIMLKNMHDVKKKQSFINGGK